MADVFGFPSPADCLQAARAAYQAACAGLNAWLWPNTIGPSAKVVGAAQWSVYQRLDFVGRQAFALFAKGKYLDMHGAELSLPRKLAQAATGNVVVTATADVAIAPGAQFQRGDGALFAATAAATLSAAGSVGVAVAGAAGQASNTAAGTPMTIVSGVTGDGAAGATAAVDSNGLFGGADVEPDGAPRTRDLATYRGRILFRKANPPQCGAPSDYVSWAGALAGVTRVFVERTWNGPGTVRVFPLFDALFASAGGVPDAGHVAVVNAALQALAPADAALTVAAPTPTPIAVAVTNLNPNTTSVQTAIRAELADAFQRLGRVSGNNTAIAGMPYLASPFTFMADWIEAAVANAAGVVSADVAASDTAISEGCIPTLGTVTIT
jgi:uncharacterized phage protein gp47/JayE